MLQPGDPAPDLGFEGPHLVWFWKDGCPTARIAAPAAARLGAALPVVVVSQDGTRPPNGAAPAIRDDADGLALSRAFAPPSIPAAFLVCRGRVDRAVLGWSRDDYNALARRAARLAGVPAFEVSHPGDGAPPFRPG
jgi:hypothetical protein